MGQRDRGRLATALLALPALALLAVAAPRAAGQQTPTEGMAQVPAGDYWMGRTRLWLMDEINWQIRDRMDDRPVHRVSLDAFWIDTHEVTNADYAAFVKATDATTPYQWGGPTPPANKADLPIYNVSWHDATAYCTWLGKRLPTEAEWEKAARGGIEDSDYPWGNEYETVGEPPAAPAPAAPAAPAPDQPAAPVPPAAPVSPPAAPVISHAHSSSASGPRPVGSYPPNGYGLYDMSGNVWEWVSDWYDLYYYGVSPIKNPTGPPDGHYKVIRGGSWADSDPRLGATYFRNYVSPDEQSPTVGFRCAK